jgi:phosphoribosylformimino-5-aminoimidazole carboxamide ribotide isomerase
MRGGHVIMLGPGNEDAARSALKTWPGGLQVGGGITGGNAAQWIETGAEAVIVTSWCFSNGEVLFERMETLQALVGREHLVLDLSCRKKKNDFYIVTDRWQNFTNVKITRETLEGLSDYCFEFLIHAADVEGKCRGI